MQVKEVMTADPACCTPNTSLQEVAQMMIGHDCGEIPVIENDKNKRLIGVITDRDIVCRTVAKGLNPLELRGVGGRKVSYFFKLLIRRPLDMTQKEMQAKRQEKNESQHASARRSQESQAIERGENRGLARRESYAPPAWTGSPFSFMRRF